MALFGRWKKRLLVPAIAVVGDRRTNGDADADADHRCGGIAAALAPLVVFAPVAPTFVAVRGYGAGNEGAALVAPILPPVMAVAARVRVLWQGDE